jgi:hypothetical protein
MKDKIGCANLLCNMNSKISCFAHFLGDLLFAGSCGIFEPACSATFLPAWGMPGRPEGLFVDPAPSTAGNILSQRRGLKPDFR